MTCSPPTSSVALAPIVAGAPAPAPIDVASLDPQRRSTSPTRPPASPNQGLIPSNSQATVPVCTAAPVAPSLAAEGIALSSSTVAAAASAIDVDQRGSQQPLTAEASPAVMTTQVLLPLGPPIAPPAPPPASSAPLGHSMPSVSAWVQSIGGVAPEGYSEVGTPPVFAWTGDMSSPVASEGSEWDFAQRASANSSDREPERRDSDD